MAVGPPVTYPPTMSAFALGTLMITPGAEAVLPYDFAVACFRRHAQSDFGELDAEDVAVNLTAIALGHRILSQYTHEGVKAFVITDADRRRTTLLLASEY